MKTERAPFLPVSSDIDDDKLERLAQSKGVGSIVMAPAIKDAAGKGDTVAQPVEPSKSDQVEATASGATPRSRMKTVNLELPDYVWTDLKIRAARKQTSVRHIIMTALKAEGIIISEVDMVEDGRRVRGSNKLH